MDYTWAKKLGMIRLLHSRKRLIAFTKLCHFAPPPLRGRGKMAKLRKLVAFHLLSFLHHLYRCDQLSTHSQTRTGSRPTSFRRFLTIVERRFCRICLHGWNWRFISLLGRNTGAMHLATLSDIMKAYESSRSSPTAVCPSPTSSPRTDSAFFLAKPCNWAVGNVSRTSVLVACSPCFGSDDSFQKWPQLRQTGTMLHTDRQTSLLKHEPRTTARSSLRWFWWSLLTTVLRWAVRTIPSSLPAQVCSLHFQLGQNDKQRIFLTDKIWLNVTCSNPAARQGSRLFPVQRFAYHWPSLWWGLGWCSQNATCLQQISQSFRWCG